MCQLDKNTEQQLEETITSFIIQGRAFTGYDVTIETRNREKIKLRHNDVRSAIHEIDCLRDAVDFDDWNKKLVDVGNGNQAILYYKDGYDVSQYQPIQNGDSPVTSSISMGSTNHSVLSTDDNDIDDADDVGGEQSDGTFKSDYRGRLLIKTKFLRVSGLNAGDSIYVVIGNDNVSIAPNTDCFDDASNFTTQIVEKNGEVRISKKTLTKASIYDTKFTVENVTADDGVTVIVKIMSA